MNLLFSTPNDNEGQSSHKSVFNDPINFTYSQWPMSLYYCILINASIILSETILSPWQTDSPSWNNKPSSMSLWIYSDHTSFYPTLIPKLMTVNPGPYQSFTSFSKTVIIKSVCQARLPKAKKIGLKERFRIISFYMCVKCVDDVFVFIILPHKYVKSRIRPLKGLLSEIKPPLAASRLFLLSDDPEYLMRPKLSLKVMVWIITTIRHLQHMDPFISIISGWEF